MTLFGYGKLLDVDLSKETVVKKEIAPEFAREYIGGMGFGCKIVYDEVGVDVDPLGKDNIVVFANGPLTGTRVPCSGRTEVTTKSPLTGHIGSGNTGGLWGTALKHAGLDVIVVRGQSPKPVYLWIDDDKVQIKEAAHLWGKDTRETYDALRKELDTETASKVSVLAIGPAGENLVKFACPVNDIYHSASRTGAGAVIGSKKLKAIAVRGTGVVKVAQPEKFDAIVKEARERLLAADAAAKMPGAAEDSRKVQAERGCLPGKNYQTGVLPGWMDSRTGDQARKYFTKKEGTCYACPVSCFNLVEVKEGKHAGLKVSRGLMPGVVFDWGAKCAIDNLPAIWRCKELCQLLGMDYGSTAANIAFSTELFQRGIISEKDTNGLKLSWGDEDAVIQMIQKIAYREGFGDVLAEGSVRAAKKIGKGAEKFAMTIRGMEMMSPDPRSGPRFWCFGHLTNPRGGDNIKNTHCHAEHYNPHWWTDKFDIPEDIKQRIYSMPPHDVGKVWQEKPLMCKWFEDLYSIINALGICFMPAGFKLAWGPTYLSSMYSAVTGIETSPQELMKYAEKVFTLLKVHTVRYGLSRKDDTWPDRFFTEPVSEGPAKGAILSRETIDRLLDEYYELRGWDKKTGLPTKQKLIELGLGDIGTQLAASGKIPEK